MLFQNSDRQLTNFTCRSIESGRAFTVEGVNQVRAVAAVLTGVGRAVVDVCKAMTGQEEICDGSFWTTVLTFKSLSDAIYIRWASVDYDIRRRFELQPRNIFEFYFIHFNFSYCIPQRQWLLSTNLELWQSQANMTNNYSSRIFHHPHATFGYSDFDFSVRSRRSIPLLKSYHWTGHQKSA